MSAPQDLVIVGAGEHARVVLDAALSRPGEWRLAGYVDRAETPETTRRFGLRWLGDDARALADDDLVRRAHFVLGVGGIGVSPVRAEIAARYDLRSVRWACVVHARAWVSHSAATGAGAVVMAGAVVNTGARVGRHCVVNTGAVVEHDVVLGDFAQAGPAAALGGGVVVGAGSYLGLGCRIRDHVTIGSGVTVGMGAAVTADVADGSVVAGVPARPLGGR